MASKETVGCGEGGRGREGLERSTGQAEGQEDGDGGRADAALEGEGVAIAER